MDASPEQISALADQLSQLAKGVASTQDPMSRKHQTQALVMQAKQMIWQIQDPFDALMDHVVNGYTIAATLSLSEMGVFEAIPLQGTATLSQIARQCDADEELITRLMRQLTCVNIFTEVSLGEWSHNRLSIGISDHIGMSGKYFFKVSIGEMLPSILTLPSYFHQFGRHSLLHTYTDTPHSWSNNMLGKNFWEVLSSSPERIDTFSRGLSLFSSLHPVVAMFPFTEKLQPENSAQRTLAVDIGGGRGLAMLELRKGCPSLEGELILQDRPVVLDEIAPEDLPGVTKMPHDFFAEQPVKHAQVYYIRRVMHDWQDVDATRILKAIVPAMAPDSRILISDMCLPEPVTPRDVGAIWLDLMMLSIGGKERTAGDWKKLADLSGLELVKIWQELDKFGPLCVVEYRLPKMDDGVNKTVKGGGVEQVLETPNPSAAPLAPGENASVVAAARTGDIRDVDWEERTVVGDRDGSVEPGSTA